MNGNCQELSSKLRKGDETIVIWNLKEEREIYVPERERYDPRLPQSLCKCVVDVGGGNGGARAKLRFYFEATTAEKEAPPPIPSKHNGWGKRINTTWLAWLGLHADQVFNVGGRVLQYEIKLDRLDDQLQVLPHEENFVERIDAVKEMKLIRNLEVKNEFIKLQEMVNYNDTEVWRAAYHPEILDLLLKISVTPIYAEATCDVQNQGGVGAESPKEEESFFQALKGMFAAEENYSDLKLETKDNMTLSAHKFILAARSPVLRARIERAVKENDFNGTIKLVEVNAKPMMAILHWMYTCELHENAGNFIEDVVDAAIKFELTDLIKILDKKVIDVCNPDNMFQLYKTAKKNGTMTAMADVSKFIKENI